MSEWIIVRDGPFRYLKSRDPLDAFSEEQKYAYRFTSRVDARTALAEWDACCTGSWECRIVKLVPRTAAEGP